MQSVHKSFVSLFVLMSIIFLSTSQAQSLSHPDSKSPLKPNKYLKHQNPWRWDINSQVFLRSGSTTVQFGQVVTDRANDALREVSEFTNAKKIEYIYPLVTQGGHYWTPNATVDTRLRVNDDEYPLETKVMQTPGSEVPYFYWENTNSTYNVRQLHIQQKTHVVSADTVFNEELAKELPWPDQWAPEPQRFLVPIIDRIEDPINKEGEERLAALVEQWIEGSDPKSIDQITLTKFMTGKVIEYVRESRGRIADARDYIIRQNQGALDPTQIGPADSWAGLEIRSADQIALNPSGSVLDYSSFLVAVLRSVQVPARLVICYVNDIETVEELRIRALVEFAIYDPVSDQTLWIPIDTEELRDQGRRSNLYQQRWLYFGTNDKSRNYVPIAYYAHPPVNYKAYGYPALYGIRGDPEIQHLRTQQISIDVTNSPLRGDELNIPSNP